MAEIMSEDASVVADSERSLAHEHDAHIIQALAGVLWQGFPRPAIPNSMLRELCSSMLAYAGENSASIIVAEADGPVVENSPFQPQ